MIRVAVLAYACKSEAGSEPGAGFQWAIAAARSATVEIITRPIDTTTRRELEASGITVHELPITHIGRIPQLSYLRWILAAQKKLQQLHQATPFQLVHHVTYATDWLPAPRLPDIPLIWGPIGGSTGMPKELAQFFTVKLRTKEAIRAAITSMIRWFTLRWATKNVHTLIAQNQDTAKTYKKVRNVYVRPNYIVSHHSDSQIMPSRDLDVAIVGRLIEMKGVHIAISALATKTLAGWRLHVIGDGPMRSTLIEQAKAMGVSERVIFHGQLDRNEVYAQLQKMRCSLLLSTHDAAGWSAAESIALSTPVHTWDHGGPAELVRATGCGTTTVPTKDSIATLATRIADFQSDSRVDMTNYYHESLALQLEKWYDKAVK